MPSLRAPALYPLGGLIAGLLLARHFPLPALALALAALGLAGLSLTVARAQPRVWLPLFLGAALVGGWAYGSLRLIPTPDDASLRLPLREATLSLQVDRVMIERNRFDKGSGIGVVQEATPTSRLPVGARIYFRMQLPEEERFNLVRGQILRLTGVLSPLPPETKEGSFEDYLKDTGIHYSFARNSGLEVLRDASAFDRFCHAMNERFRAYLKLGAPEDRELDGVYTAMLLGEKTALSPDQKDRFRMTGTMHLFAISGLHIGVVAAVIAQALLLLRIPRVLAPVIGLPLLYLYVEITGAAPSAVRAFLMVAFFWSSLALDRQRSPLAAMVGSAVFVLLVQPWQLWQIGFQLSYLVVASILLFGLPLYARFGRSFQPFRDLPDTSQRAWHRVTVWSLDKVLMLFAISLSAWLISAPLGAGFFGYIAPYAVWINLFLVNLAALAITTGVLSLCAAVAHFAGGSWLLNHAAWVVIHAMEAIVDLNLSLPGAVIQCPNFPKAVSYGTVFILLGTLLAANATGQRKWWFAAAGGVALGGLALGLLLGAGEPG